jgi:hypothetical protein
VLALVVGLMSAGAAAGKKGTGYQTGFDRWRAADDGFAGWTFDHTALAGGAIVLAGGTAGTDVPGAFNGRNMYNGGSYVVGEATSPEVTTGSPLAEGIASWNADTPPGTWIETQVRGRIGDRWTKWFNLGVWASGDATVERHSVNGQRDADGSAIVDTLVLDGKAGPGNAYQLKVRLFSAGGTSSPTVRNMSFAYSTAPGKVSSTSTDDPGVPNRILDLPDCSLMVYPDGGEVWCSPTSTSMVLGYWGIDPGPCEPRVRAAVEGVFDWLYDGHGNWPFNTAYAASRGLEGYVARYTSLRDLEPWIQAGIPVVFSFAWKKSQLDGAAIPSSSGHLAVLVGFDASGNPVVNDPAAASDAAVPRTYDRAQLETVWLEASGGTVYLMYPPGTPTPPLG